MRADRSERTEADFSRAIPAAVRRRLCHGEVRSGKDATASRRFVGMTQEEFARAVGIGAATLQNGEQGRRRPRALPWPSPGVARDPRVLRRILSPTSTDQTASAALAESRAYPEFSGGARADHNVCNQLPPKQL